MHEKENSRACISTESSAVRILCCEEMKVPGQKASNKVKEKHKGIDKGGKKSIFQARFVRSRRADGSGGSRGVFIRHQLWWGTPAGTRLLKGSGSEEVKEQELPLPWSSEACFDLPTWRQYLLPRLPWLSSFLCDNRLLSPVSEDLCLFSSLNWRPWQDYFKHFFLDGLK